MIGKYISVSRLLVLLTTSYVIVSLVCQHPIPVSLQHYVNIGCVMYGVFTILHDYFAFIDVITSIKSMENWSCMYEKVSRYLTAFRVTLCHVLWYP